MIRWDMMASSVPRERAVADEGGDHGSPIQARIQKRLATKQEHSSRNTADDPPSERRVPDRRIDMGKRLQAALGEHHDIDVDTAAW